MNCENMITRKNEQGVALIEVVFVVAIGLIVIGMAVPTLLSTQRNYRAIGDANNVAAEILLAKMRAASDFTQSRVHRHQRQFVPIGTLG